jgi:hypothetical protein
MPESLAIASISKVGGIAAVAADGPLAMDAGVEGVAELGADDEVTAGLELGLPPAPLEHAASAIERAAAMMGPRRLRLWAS